MEPPSDIDKYENEEYFKNVIHNHPSQSLLFSCKADLPFIRGNFLLYNLDAAQLICFHTDRIEVLIRQNIILAGRRFAFKIERDSLNIKRYPHRVRIIDNLWRIIENH
ncbi:hypothetical protein KAR91_35205 [Candidatus Pacearchaeota archaeon]|nr:hypothetical protein [Candidatus Pacearchaeota archaeon]